MKIHDLVGQIKDLMDKGIEILQSKRIGIEVSHNFAEIVQAIKETGKKPALEIKGAFNNFGVLSCHTDTELVDNLTLDDIIQSGEVQLDVLSQTSPLNFTLSSSDENFRFQNNQVVEIQLKQKAYKYENSTSQKYCKVIEEPIPNEILSIGLENMTALSGLPSKSTGTHYFDTPIKWGNTYIVSLKSNYNSSAVDLADSNNNKFTFTYNDSNSYRGRQLIYLYEGIVQNSEIFQKFYKFRFEGLDRYYNSLWGESGWNSKVYYWDFYLFENGDAMIQVITPIDKCSGCSLNKVGITEELESGQCISFYRLNPEGTKWKIDKNIYAWGLD